MEGIPNRLSSERFLATHGLCAVEPMRDFLVNMSVSNVFLVYGTVVSRRTRPSTSS